MYQVIHFAAECYPIAKTGGLGDVVGALPKYLIKKGLHTAVFLPWYDQKWNHNNPVKHEWHGNLTGANYNVNYEIIKSENNNLGFDVFFVHIPDLLYRPNIYGYSDDPLRFLFFQHAALDFINTWDDKPGVFHCHDHHTGLIPFMIRHCYKFYGLQHIKTVFTIHNGLYTGAFSWSLSKYLPDFHERNMGFLDWSDTINPLATGVKCCDYMTTVSEGYLDELKFGENPLQRLYNETWMKSRGIVNGIDSDVWNPATDPYLENKMTKDIHEFKKANKLQICEASGFDPYLPLVVFIGRLVSEKGGLLIPDTIKRYLSFGQNINFYILGSGVNYIEDQLKECVYQFPKNSSVYIGYNEALAHQLYAAADFLLMPSLIEPCGLNQLYAMRYGTIPVVRRVGGLKDTVKDFGEWEGYGICFNNASIDDIVMSLYRGELLHKEVEKFKWIREYIIQLNYSWDVAVEKYIEIYKK